MIHVASLQDSSLAFSPAPLLARKERERARDRETDQQHSSLGDSLSFRDYRFYIYSFLHKLLIMDKKISTRFYDLQFCTLLVLWRPYWHFGANLTVVSLFKMLLFLSGLSFSGHSHDLRQISQWILSISRLISRPNNGYKATDNELNPVPYIQTLVEGETRRCFCRFERVHNVDCLTD